MNQRRYFGTLYAEPSFIEGMASVLDLGNTLHLYNKSRTSPEADVEALKDDWCTVGEDLRISIATYERTKEHIKSV